MIGAEISTDKQRPVERPRGHRDLDFGHSGVGKDPDPPRIRRPGNVARQPPGRTAEPGSEAEALSHGGEEMVYVVEGSISVYHEGHGKIELLEGDAFTYPANVIHQWRTTSDETAQFLFINAPPSF